MTMRMEELSLAIIKQLGGLLTVSSQILMDNTTEDVRRELFGILGKVVIFP